MSSRSTEITKSRRRRTAVCVFLTFVLLGFAGINIASFFHARAMTTFTESSNVPGRPEDLSIAQRVQLVFTGIRLPRPENESSPAQYGLSWETDTVVTSDNTRLELWTIPGSGAGVISIFHGYRASKAQLLVEAAAFHNLGYTTVLVDFRGSGGSAGNVTTIGWEEALDVQAVAKYVQQRYPGVCHVMYGQSMGAAAIMRAVALDSTTADGLIIEGVYDRLSTTVGHRFEAMGLPSFPFAQLLVFWGGVQHGFNGFSLDPIEYARDIRIPSLVIHGAEDRRAKIGEARALYQQLAGEKQFQEFTGVGHASCLDADPSLWNTTVAKFLSEACTGRD